MMPVIILILLLLGSSSVECQRPSFVNVGAVFTFNSVIGRAAKVAMELAVSDINADPRILNGTQLKLMMEDAECNVFLGSMRGTYLKSQLPYLLPPCLVYLIFLVCVSNN